MKYQGKEDKNQLFSLLVDPGSAQEEEGPFCKRRSPTMARKGWSQKEGGGKSINGSPAGQTKAQRPGKRPMSRGRDGAQGSTDGGSRVGKGKEED